MTSNIITGIFILVVCLALLYCVFREEQKEVTYKCTMNAVNYCEHPSETCCFCCDDVNRCEFWRCDQYDNCEYAEDCKYAKKVRK